MSTAVLLGLGALLGLVGVFGVMGDQKHVNARFAAVSLGILFFGISLVLKHGLPLDCDNAARAMVVFGAQSTGQSVPHSAVLGMGFDWAPMQYLAKVMIGLGILILIALFISRRALAWVRWIFVVSGLVGVGFALAGLFGWVGPHLDMDLLNRLSLYNQVAHVPTSIQVFMPQPNCKTGAVLSSRVFLQFGALGIFVLAGALETRKNTKRLRDWMNMAVAIFVIVLGLAGQFLLLPSMVRVLAVIILTLVVVAAAIRDTELSVGASTLAFGLVMLLPFL